MATAPATLTPEQSAYRQAAKAELARRSLLRFAHFTRPYYKANWHHRALCDKLDAFAEGKIKKLMVFAPPRSGKSELVSRCLPAYLLGRNPDARVAAASYAADLARLMGRAVQRSMDEAPYKLLFPATQLEGSNIRTVADGRYLRNSDEFEVVGKKGGYVCRGIGGGLTGRGFDFGIIDDPVKDASEAWSEVVRNAVWEWYTQVFLTRQEANASILLTMTRWHEDDLAGRILNSDDGKNWELVKFQALNQAYEGGTLWPEKYDLAWMEGQKKALGSRSFESLYQQEPRVGDGGIWRTGWFKQWRALPGDLTNYTQSWDFAAKDTKDGSYNVGQVWAERGPDKYLLDQVRFRGGMNDALTMFKALCNKWPQCRAKLIEDKANGSPILNMLEQEIGGLIATNPGVRGKAERAQAVAPFIEAGNVWVPAESNWLSDFLSEIEAFPNGAHDDQVDTASQALERLCVPVDTGGFELMQDAMALL